jgi:pyruvate,water dikinase
VLEVMAEGGLQRGKNGREIYVMCEIPSNFILARAFAERFDGFSIGSNDLIQLTLGVDRDLEELADLFDERIVRPSPKRPSGVCGVSCILRDRFYFRQSG